MQADGRGSEGSSHLTLKPMLVKGFWQKKLWAASSWSYCPVQTLVLVPTWAVVQPCLAMGPVHPDLHPWAHVPDTGRCHTPRGRTGPALLPLPQGSPTTLGDGILPPWVTRDLTSLQFRAGEFTRHFYLLLQLWDQALVHIRQPNRGCSEHLSGGETYSWSSQKYK